MSILEETSLQTENGLATEEHDLSENKSYLSDNYSLISSQSVIFLLKYIYEHILCHSCCNRLFSSKEAILYRR